MSENKEQTSDVESGPATGGAGASGEDASRAISQARGFGLSALTKTIFYPFCALLGEVTAVVMGVMFIWLCLLNILIGQRVADVSFLKADASRWFSSAFDGKSADVGKMTLAWEAANNTVVFRANDIAVKSGSDALLTGLSYVETELSLRDIVQGKLDPIRVVIDGGELSFLRDVEGNFIAGLGTPDTVGQFGPVWRGERNDGDNDLEIGRIKSLKIANAKLYLRDAGTNYAAQFNSAKFDVAFVPDAIVFDMAADLSVDGDVGAAPLKLKGRLSPDLEDVDVNFTGNNFYPASLLPKFRQVEILSEVNAPVAFDVHVVATRKTGLETIETTVKAGRGTMNNKVVNDFDSASLVASFNPKTEVLNISNLSLLSRSLSVEGKASLLNIGSPAQGFFNKNTEFDVGFDQVKIESLPVFLRKLTIDDGKPLEIRPLDIERMTSVTKPAAFEVSDFKIAGKINALENKAVFDKLSADFGTFQPRFKGSLTRNENGKPIAASLSGRVDGTLSHEQLLSLWPETLIIGARRWVDFAINQATISNLNIRFDGDEAVLSGQPLANENLTVTFDITGGDVNYISTMTPVSGLIGSGVLLGNQLDFDVKQGSVSDVQIQDAKVTIPRIYPYGGDLIIKGQAQGPLKTLVGLLDQKPLAYVTPYGLNPDEFSGTGDITLSITRPLRSVVTYDRIDYEILGQLSDVTVPFAIGKNTLTNGNVTLLANKEGLSVKGPVKIGPWQTNLSWREVFDNGATPSRYQVEGRLSQTDLDSFGIGLREFIGGGDIGVTIDAKADGLAITGAQLAANLKETEMRIGPYWNKPKGIEGMMTGQFSFTEDSQLVLRNIKVKSPGLDLEGEVKIGSDFKLQNMSFSKAKIAGFIDAAAQVKPSPDQTRFDIYLTGDFLDVSPFVATSFDGGGGTLDVPILLTGSIARLALSESYLLKDTTILFAHDGIGITEARLKGVRSDGALAITLLSDDAKYLRTLDIDIPNASDAAFAFFDMQSLKGGRIKLNADLPAVGVEGPLTGTLRVDDVTIVEAPIMTTMLSLASLQGLSDALGGQGLKFTELVLPFSFTKKGRLSIREGRASGPGLGMTGNGEIDFTLKALDIDGVLVPAYTANSLLGSVPLIGDIFVGKKGEGIFALNYTVQGPFGKAQVAVNPLSALTPGFLRGIFSTQRDDLPEQLRKKIESVRPSELPPEK